MSMNTQGRNKKITEIKANEIEHQKMFEDFLIHGTGIMRDGKHIPYEDTRRPSYDDLEQLYFAQCALTDAFAEKAKEQGDATLRARIVELEQQLATVNARLIAQNVESAKVCHG